MILVEALDGASVAEILRANKPQQRGTAAPGTHFISQQRLRGEWPKWRHNLGIHGILDIDHAWSLQSADWKERI